MRFDSYWQDTAPAFTGGADAPVEGPYDVAVIGGGFTGLGAARQLAMGGARVVLLEAGGIGAGGSGRNGGHLNNGIAHGYAAAKRTLGAERAAALYKAYDASIDTMEQIIAEEGIDCSFRRSGKLKMASKPGHYDALARNYDLVHREVDPDTALLSAAEVRQEIGSDRFHGGVLFRKSAMVHMGRYAVGLAEAAARHGALIHEHTSVTGHTLRDGLHHLETPKGTVRAKDVVLATGAYTPGFFSYFRRRIVPVGSFIIATRPLTLDEVAATVPGNRTYVTTLNVGNYFRLAPDNRLIFGGRARFSATSDQRSDAKSGEILRASMAVLFPHLAQVEIDYCWGGMVDMTKDRFPRAGYVDGVWFAMGYSGHGAQMSTLMGMRLADAILGKSDDVPMRGVSWPAIPGHFGKPWFLPMVGAYYRFLDLIR